MLYFYLLLPIKKIFKVTFFIILFVQSNCTTLRIRCGGAYGPTLPQKIQHDSDLSLSLTLRGNIVVRDPMRQMVKVRDLIFSQLFWKYLKITFLEWNVNVYYDISKLHWNDMERSLLPERFIFIYKFNWKEVSNHLKFLKSLLLYNLRD